MNNKAVKTLISALIGFALLGVVIFYLYRYTDFFDGIKKFFSSKSNNTSQSENFDREAYVGMYYFESETTVTELLEGYYTESPTSTTVRKVGDKIGNITITESNYITFEIKKDTYEYIVHYSTTIYTLGSWTKVKNREDTFNFYSGNNVLQFSAKMKDGTITIKNTDNIGVGKQTVTRVFVRG